MSAPQTDPKTQARRHSPAMIGIGASVVVVLLVFVLWLFGVFAGGETPGDDQTAPRDSAGTVQTPG
ncbi:MAG: hypothetical protein KDA73_19335 [Rhodobacteraceae bacterium]|nr:hypothetical protein [Paracoccaceae bacterium]